MGITQHVQVGPIEDTQVMPRTCSGNCEVKRQFLIKVTLY